MPTNWPSVGCPTPDGRWKEGAAGVCYRSPSEPSFPKASQGFEEVFWDGRLGLRPVRKRRRERERTVNQDLLRLHVKLDPAKDFVFSHYSP
ncbi:hypothetical protein RPHASCH2410_PD03565 (plasmid) [Rhizobium phaseoli Ch24-10]|nr:hypothetical protein RPHASCH2410_PD03565 [Rhizobium phaseoli Ch24-10]